jgi:Zn-dependent protease with chaperone function
MQVIVFIPLLLPALAAVAARPLAARLDPRQATWLLAAGALILAACSTVSLALLAARAMATVPALAALGHYSLAVIRQGDPAAIFIGITAAVLLASAAVTSIIWVRRRGVALAESYRRASRLRAGRHRVVVLPSPAIEAYALPGWPGRVVVSTGALDALDSRGRAALLAHEQAHLAGQHHLFTTAARLAATVNPFLLPVADAVDYTTERWADERAACATGDRRLVAATIGQIALLVTTPPGASLSIAGSAARSISLAWAGPVPRRVAALLAPPPRQRSLLLAATAAAFLLAGASALEATTDLHALLELARAAAR